MRSGAIFNSTTLSIYSIMIMHSDATIYRWAEWAYPPPPGARLDSTQYYYDLHSLHATGQPICCTTEIDQINSVNNSCSDKRVRGQPACLNVQKKCEGANE
jgi:hypothetical protein